MASNSFLDKPLLKVSRPVAACSRCRTAKIKCDGKLPACSACERVGKASTCSGASDEFARGKERSYVASLEGYCERLEKKIADLRQRKEALSSDGSGPARESSITSNSSNSASHTHRKEVSDIDDLVGDFGFLSVNATSRDFHGISSSASFANLLLSLALTQPIQSLPPPSPLPARHEITPLVQFYFENLFPQLPFFNETSFFSSVDSIYQNGGRFAKPSDHWFLRVVLAISAASDSYRVGDRNYQKALSFISGALPYAEEVLRPGSIQGIQAILLLAQYSLLDPKHFRSWYLVGMAVRVLVDLGLHQDPPTEVLLSGERLDMRRRVFHCVYSLDRLVSTAFERTFSLSDQSINVALPPKSDAGSSPVFLHSLDPAWHMVEIRQILSTAYQKKYLLDHETCLGLRESNWQLCLRARQWLNNIPDQSPKFFPVLCRLEYFYTTIMILSPAGASPVPYDYDKVLLFDYCLYFIDELHKIWHGSNLAPLLTSLDIQRVSQVSRLCIDLLSQDYDLVLTPSEPELPPVPPDTPASPTIHIDDRINCHRRAMDCLFHTRTLLQFGVEKWQLRPLLDTFDVRSAGIQHRLMQSTTPQFLGDESYRTGQAVPTLPANNPYGDFDYRHFDGWKV